MLVILVLWLVTRGTRKQLLSCAFAGAISWNCTWSLGLTHCSLANTNYLHAEAVVVSVSRATSLCSSAVPGHKVPQCSQVLGGGTRRQGGRIKNMGGQQPARMKSWLVQSHGAHVQRWPGQVFKQGAFAHRSSMFWAQVSYESTCGTLKRTMAFLFLPGPSPGISVWRLALWVNSAHPGVLTARTTVGPHVLWLSLQYIKISSMQVLEWSRENTATLLESSTTLPRRLYEACPPWVPRQPTQECYWTFQRTLGPSRRAVESMKHAEKVTGQCLSSR